MRIIASDEFEVTLPGKPGPLPSSGRHADAFDLCLEDMDAAGLLGVIERRRWRDFAIGGDDLARAKARFASRLKRDGPLAKAGVIYTSADGVMFRATLA